MADKLRRAKDVLKRNVSSYLETTTSGKYITYFEGTPTYITYYQLDSVASKEDIGLETVNSLVGKNTPNKYKKIVSVPVWGVDALDVSNELSERGLQSNVNGELLFLPNSIRPYPGDFFTFEYQGLESHLFRINDVQYDKISPEKFFRTQYSLWQDNVDMIFENISTEYECKYDSGTGNIDIVNAAEAATTEATEKLVDGLIDKFTSLFYDEETDTFLCNGYYMGDDEYCYWSPYLQHFLHETKALDKFNSEIMTEFYILDITETDNREIYNEMAYRNSIFRNIQIQNPDVNFDANFFCVPEYNLKCTRNLPFFMSTLKFKLITPIVKHGKDDPSAYINAFPYLFSSKLFKDVDHLHKVHKMDELHLARLEPYLKNGDIIYECYRHELEPTKICMAIEKETAQETYLEIEDISIERLMKPNTKTTDYENFELFNIIKDYLNGTFKLNEDHLAMLNDLYYKPTLENYIMIPLIVYILKQTIKKEN